MACVYVFIYEHIFIYMCEHVFILNVYVMIYIYLRGSYLSFMGPYSGFFGDDFVATRPLWTDLCRGLIWA